MLVCARVITLHYGIKAMGAMTLRISELYLSFSPHPNISDGNFNLVHHFFRIQIFQINEKGSSSADTKEKRDNAVAYSLLNDPSTRLTEIVTASGLI